MKWKPTVRYILYAKSLSSTSPILLVFARFSLSVLFIHFICTNLTIQIVGKNETFHVTSVYYSCFFLSQSFDMIRGTNNRTWWQWFTDFTAIFAHKHINYTFQRCVSVKQHHQNKSERQISRRKTIVNVRIQCGWGAGTMRWRVGSRKK